MTGKIVKAEEEGSGPAPGGVVIGENPFGWPHVHSKIPRNSSHNPVIGQRANGQLGYICSGNAYSWNQCTFFD
ncbi:hypothetical protein [Pedobacter sp. Hv1]|uniref:hypothetical protein n=1 Tax=Pedobacter sp. Hv1 TaxID=1740090 RepID=UPI00128FBE8A|nr:hypothetical protein [Pedobacter sp. Hv1]